jgi:hypothetical protein
MSINGLRANESKNERPILKHDIMKKRTLLLFAASIITIAAVNVRINVQNKLSYVSAEARADGSPEGQDLSKGCGTTYVSSFDYGTKITTKKYSCVSGSGKQCKYGTEYIKGGVVQAGSSVTTYTCR